MNQEPVFTTAMSRREFNRMLLGGAVLLGAGATVLDGCGAPQEVATADIPPDQGINGPGGGDLKQAERLETPVNTLNPLDHDMRGLFVPGALYRTFNVGGQKLVHLTFDDGPWPVNTIAIMDILARNGLEGYATFFQVADNVRQFLAIAQEVVARGYTIGNHSKTHSSYVPSVIAGEIPVAEQMIYDLLGVRADIFRSPGLTEGQVIQDMLRQYGMCNIFTDRDPNDWTVPRISSLEIISNVTSQLHPGLVNLLHDGGTHLNTVNAVQGIIDNARSLGYTFVTMKQMMQAAMGAVLTNNRVENYVARPQYLDFSNDTFDRVAELDKIGLVAA